LGVRLLRVSITGEADFVNSLTGLEEAPIEIESVARHSDDTEQQFGLLELMTVIAAVKGVVELTNTILKLWESRRSQKKQRLRLKSPVGTITLELDADSTVEDVRRAIAPLFAE
jgi:hypothetical protein